MRTLILYATKYGATCKIAESIADSMGGAVLHDLKQGGIPALAGFDCVIIGSSLYAGSIRKEAKVFLAQNADQLSGKRLGLFLSGLAKSDEQKYFRDNFPADLLEKAKAACFLDGIFDPKKAGAVERLIMKAVTKQSGYVSTIDEAKIKQFAALMQA